MEARFGLHFTVIFLDS
jgi:hypothetical protein